MKHSRRAFTLVELLVVIGIIAVLISLLLPSLSRVRRQANTIKCMSNLRTIMQAVQFYANDNRGAMVPALWHGQSGAPVQSIPSPQDIGYPGYWWEALPSDEVLLGKYTDPVPHGKILFDASSNIWGYIVNRNSVWRCPERIPSSATEKDNFYLTSYALNYGVFPNILLDATHPTGWEYEWKITTIRSPSRMMGFVDSTCERFNPSTLTSFFGNSYGANGNWNGGTTYAAYNHAIRHNNNQTNVGYIDGHVQSLQNRMWTSGSSTGLSLAPSYQKGDFVVNATDP
jgi:prepilin-type N-terminal cleavage/methylation domain-containing protein/prepilin-type processing-associated H-X9-DG protein